MSQKFIKYIEDSTDLKYFGAHELLFKGGSHSTPGSSGYQLNTDPPEDLWPKILPAIILLDKFRERIGVPITITSAYRSPAYNKSIDGALSSYHTKFQAIDFRANGVKASNCVQELIEMRQAKLFKGGIGRYASFTHVDTRGYNADW